MVVVLCSGGVDSIVCAEIARERGKLAGLVFCDYGHPARQAEAWRAFRWAEQKGERLHVVHAMGLHLAEMDGLPGASPQIVPARNAILISLAANVAAMWGAKEVWIGANQADRPAYPDCGYRFMEHMSRAMLEAIGISVFAPLATWDKPKILAKARALGIDAESVWACYGGGPRQCGECSSCVHAGVSPPSC